MLFILFFSISQSIRALETYTPASDTIPISVSIEQMTSQHGDCDVDSVCTTEKNCKPDCGERCFGNNGDFFEYEFSGEQFQIYGSTGENYADIVIYLDDNQLDTISTSGSVQARTLLYTSQVFKYGKYKIKVTNGNSGKQFGIYKFTYWPSIKAKRVNFTDPELGGGGNWQKRTDGIGGVVGWINNADGVAQTTLPTSKIWIYGAKDPGNGKITISLNKNDQKIYEQTVDESSEGKKIEGCLIFESNQLDFSYYLITVLNPNRIVNNDKMYISLSYIFYEYDPPAQSPAPNPSPTLTAVTQEAFIDKTYHDYIPCGFPSIQPNSVVKKITGCKFYNLYPGEAFLNGPINAEIEFSNNLFEYDDGVENPAISWVRLSTKLTIDHCTFTNFKHSKQAGEGLVLSFNQQIAITFDSCVFNNIGRSEAHFIFKLNGANSVLKMLNCTFHNDDNNDGSKISDLQTNADITFDKCIFDKPARDMIRMTQTDSATGRFYFTNNIVQKVKKSFIMASQVKNAITIQNNVFQDVDMTSSYLISFTLYNYGLNIDLFNNTFQRITTHTDSSYGGGISSWYQSIYNKPVNLKYRQCHFYDITNNNERSPYNQGGALQYGYTTSISNVAVTLQNCEFKRNNCANGYGGAVAFSIDSDLTISNCVFEDNHAHYSGGAIYFYSKIVKPNDNPNAPDYSGPINIKTISITNCQFKGNNGGDGHAIYISEYYSLTNAKLLITGCTFTDNGEGSNMISAVIGEIHIEDNTVQFNDKSKSSGVLYVNNAALKSIKLINNDFINCYSDQLQSINIQSIGNTESLLSVLDCNFNNCQTGGHFITFIGGNTEIDTCTFQFDNSNSAGGAFDLECYSLTLKNSNFFKTNAIGAISFNQKYTEEIKNDVLIEKCLFDQCVGANTRCFNLLIRSNSFTFRDIVFQNLHESGDSGYFIGINGEFTLDTLLIENITFKDNRCNSYYGGGSGIWFTDINTIKFINCKFLNNIALKSPTERDKPPLGATEAKYYSGDGGAFQIGYSNTIYNVNVIFEDCQFIGNKAVRHGGALALQTIRDVEIIGCTFKDNIANFESESSAELLSFNNYYSKKTNGRGGAIYINPAFSHIDSKNSSLYMKSVKIDNNNFEDNSAFDGYIMYIQGDDPGTKFEITNNVFKNNYNRDEQNKQDKSSILSEIQTIELQASNDFQYTGIDLKPQELVFGEPEDTEDDGPDYFEVINVTSHGRNDYTVTDPSNQLIVSVVLSRFNHIRSTKDGGAIYIVNAGLACNDITFDNCSTTNRGGAIFIHNTFETTNYGNIIDCNIFDCSAKIGGGVFIYSNNINYKVIVRFCNFTGNSASATADESLFGGSGAFIVARKGKVKQNTFIENNGDGNALRLSNNIKMDITLSEGKLIISKNKFVVSDSSDSSAVFYTRGKGGPLIELKDCIFEGKLKKGRHFIEGETISNLAKKLVVKNCKFQGDASNAIQLDSDFLSIDLNENHFDSVAAGIEKKQMKKSTGDLKVALTVVAVVAVVSIIAIVGFIIFFRKKNFNDVDDNEMSFDA